MNELNKMEVDRPEEGILTAIHELSQQIQVLEKRIGEIEQRINEINNRSVVIAGRQEQPQSAGR